MSDSSRYALPLLQAGQAQKEVTHNEALARIDALLHLAVESRQLSSPGSGARGCWIVGPTATGGWVGRDTQIAVVDDAGTTFVAPQGGCIAFIRDEAVFAYFDGARWLADAWPVKGLAVAGKPMLTVVPPALTAPAGGAVIDVEARAAIARLAAALAVLGLATEG